ncbi:hypothetical protein ACVR0A_06775 [Streptococcus downei]|uniref:Uncharacterized protein n=1 Tax=Streptococcus downei MFe28 TaxID=764290 RepID=A0A380JFY8_STRDO|nr:hypothetical protein [Streptococcus downei]SUN37198.1 Uncharacterised protein [Streptococcus downei MFe28]
MVKESELAKKNAELRLALGNEKKSSRNALLPQVIAFEEVLEKKIIELDPSSMSITEEGWILLWEPKYFDDRMLAGVLYSSYFSTLFSHNDIRPYNFPEIEAEVRRFEKELAKKGFILTVNDLDNPVIYVAPLSSQMVLLARYQKWMGIGLIAFGVLVAALLHFFGRATNAFIEVLYLLVGSFIVVVGLMIVSDS